MALFLPTESCSQGRRGGVLEHRMRAQFDPGGAGSLGMLVHMVERAPVSLHELAAIAGQVKWASATRRARAPMTEAPGG